MSLLLDHIEANIDRIIDNPEEMLAVTKEDAEELGIKFEEALNSASAATLTAAKHLPQYKIWKDAAAKVKAFKANNGHNPVQLSKLQADAKVKRAEFKMQRDRIVARKINRPSSPRKLL